MMEHTNEAAKHVHEAVRETTCRIDMIAESLSVLGMDRAAESLYTCIKRLQEVNRELDEATGKDISEMVRLAGQSSRNVLNAALAGAASQSGDPEQVKFAKKFIGMENDED